MSYQACVKSELDLFQPPKVQAVMEKGVFFDCYPVSALDGGNTIEFLVPASLDEYIDVHETLLIVKMKATKTDGTVIPDTEEIIPINNLMHSL